MALNGKDTSRSTVFDEFLVARSCGRCSITCWPGGTAFAATEVIGANGGGRVANDYAALECSTT